MKWDIKSVIAGLVLGVVCVVGVAAVDSPKTIGKYSIAGGYGFFVILDTETGQAWAANLATPVPGYQGVPAVFWTKKPE